VGGYAALLNGGAVDSTRRCSCPTPPVSEGGSSPRWLRACGWKLKIFVERDREAEGFKVLPKRWIVERTFSWLIRNLRNRRLSKDYESRAQTSETLLKVATIRLILRRLARNA
jgi:hypothetical protein